MPNAMTTGLAQMSANQNPYLNATPGASQPWNTPTLQHMPGEGTQNGTPGATNAFGDTYYSGGPQGSGWYKPLTNDQQIQGAQNYYATQFRNNIPQTENTLYNQFSSGQNQQMNQGIKNVQQHNSSRGLLYGGVNAGQEGAVRAQTSGALAQGRSAINQSVEGAANSMDQSAIDTGIAIQQQQQQMQNAIYSNAMAQMNAQNGVFGGLLSAGGMALGAYLGAGTGVGAVGGGLIGSSAGKVVG
jgi:hypothetical protein